MGSVTLKRGSSGPDVAELQEFLGMESDGKFGPITESAVVAFQSANKLVADGIVGPLTFAAIDNAKVKTVKASAGTPVEKTVEAVKGAINETVKQAAKATANPVATVKEKTSGMPMWAKLVGSFLGLAAVMGIVGKLGGKK